MLYVNGDFGGGFRGWMDERKRMRLEGCNSMKVGM